MTDESTKRRLNLLELLGFATDNFARSGYSIEEFIVRGMLDRWQNSLSNISDSTERRRRLKLIRRLCVAMDEIERTHGVFNVRGLESGLEAVINGEWKEVRRIADDLLYADETEHVRKAALVAHAPIREILLEACETTLPSDEDARH